MGPWKINSADSAFSRDLKVVYQIFRHYHQILYRKEHLLQDVNLPRKGVEITFQREPVSLHEIFLKSIPMKTSLCGKLNTRKRMELQRVEGECHTFKNQVVCTCTYGFFLIELSAVEICKQTEINKNIEYFAVKHRVNIFVFIYVTCYQHGCYCFNGYSNL